MSARRKGGQRGIAAVELALILPLMLTVLAAMVYLVRVLLSYNVMQDAAQNAARFMAAASQGEMSSYPRRVAVMAMTRQIVLDGASAAGLPAFQSTAMIGVFCDGVPCDIDTSKPAVIRVYIPVLQLPVDVLAGFRPLVGGGDTVRVVLDVTVPYGN